MKDSFPWLLVVCLVSLCLAQSSTSALAPIVVKGYKWFDSQTGDEFVVKGIAYEPRPNTGKLNQNSIDYFTEEYRHIWERDIPYLQSLGVNAIRLYAVDPLQNHDAFMCALNQAGIYVLVSLARDCPTCAITRDAAPACYPDDLKLQGQAVINAFAKYDNVLGFSAGNEVNHFAPDNHPEWNGPCQKRFLRDMRKYIASCPHMRKVPVGLIAADSERDEVSLYYNCASDPNDPYEHAEWFGLNAYLACNASITEFEKDKGYRELLESYQSYQYSIPVMLTEFGCLSKSFPNGGQRTFDQAKWLLENKELRDQFAGGFAFEYSIEMQNAKGDSPYPFTNAGAQNYGVGYFSPENCDDLEIPCQYNPKPSFENLQNAYQNSNILTTAKLHDFTIPEERQGRTECPSNFTALSSFQWSTDSVRDLKCPRRGQQSSFSCPANPYELRSSTSTNTENRWIMKVVYAILFLAVASFLYAFLMSFVDRIGEYVDRNEHQEPIRWIAVPKNVRKGTSSDGSSSTESTSLISARGWDYYKSNVRYHSIESEVGDERAFNFYRGGIQPQSVGSEMNHSIGSELSDESYPELKEDSQIPQEP